MAEREKQGKSYLYINTAKHLQLVVKIWKSNIEKYLLAWHLDFFFIYTIFFSKFTYRDDCALLWDAPAPTKAALEHTPGAFSLQGHLHKRGDAIFSPICNPSTCYVLELPSGRENNPRQTHVSTTKSRVQKHLGTAPSSTCSIFGLEWSGLKGTLKIIQFQPRHHGEGHLPLNQIPPSPIQPALKSWCLF